MAGLVLCEWAGECIVAALLLLLLIYNRRKSQCNNPSSQSLLTSHTLPIPRIAGRRNLFWSACWGCSRFFSLQHIPDFWSVFLISSHTFTTTSTSTTTRSQQHIAHASTFPTFQSRNFLLPLYKFPGCACLLFFFHTFV